MAALTVKEVRFKRAFDQHFETARQSLANVVGDELTSQKFYGVVAILHDLAFVAARAEAGLKPR